MEIDGRCLCGLFTYEATINPDRVVICHCTDCQISSGSAFRLLTIVRKDALRILSGQLKTYIKTAESGSKRAQAFCPECGTMIYGADVMDPKTFSIRLGTARQVKELTPSVQIWCRSALGWLAGIETKTRADQQPPAVSLTGTQ